MDRFENNPAYWRARAEETRAIAANVQEPAARKHVESMAASYERIAEMAEHVALVPAPHALKAANQP